MVNDVGGHGQAGVVDVGRVARVHSAESHDEVVVTDEEGGSLVIGRCHSALHLQRCCVYIYIQLYDYSMYPVRQRGDKNRSSVNNNNCVRVYRLLPL